MIMFLKTLGGVARDLGNNERRLRKSVPNDILCPNYIPIHEDVTV
jgi:hypothetical protein